MQIIIISFVVRLCRKLKTINIAFTYFIKTIAIYEWFKLMTIMVDIRANLSLNWHQSR